VVLGADRGRHSARDRDQESEEQAQQIPEVEEMIDNPPDWLQEWSRQIGAERSTPPLAA